MSPAALYARRRQRLEAAIERAIDLLDALDGDADLEDDAGGEDDGSFEPDFVLVERFSTACSNNAPVVPLCADGVTAQVQFMRRLPAA